MYARLQDLLQWRMSLFLTGRHGDLAQEYLYPFPIYTGGRQQVVRSAADMEATFGRLHKMSKARDIARIETWVVAIELPRGGRFRVWVAHRDFGSAGELLGSGQIVHYCRMTDAGIKTEMSDYPQCQGDWITTEPRRALA